jgi:hypothetical protein
MTISEPLLPEFDQEMANTRKLLECVRRKRNRRRPRIRQRRLESLQAPPNRNHQLVQRRPASPRHQSSNCSDPLPVPSSKIMP